MAVFRPRTRLVNFRLSEEEYQQLKESCASSGARSVSDYARAAVLKGANLFSPKAPGTNETEVYALATDPSLVLAASNALATSNGLDSPVGLSGVDPSRICLEACPLRWQRLEGSVQEIQQSLESLSQRLGLNAHSELASGQSKLIPLPSETRTQESSTNHG